MKIKTHTLITSIVFVFSQALLHGQIPWELSNSGTTLQLNGVDFITQDTGMVVGQQGLILRTTDGGEVWETVDAGVSTDLNTVRYVSETRVMAVGKAGVVIRSDDGGETWEEIPLGSSISLNGISIDRTSGKGLISGATLAMLWTADFGETWSVGMGGYMSDFYKVHMTGGDFGVAFGENSIFQPLLGYTDDSGASFDQWNFYPKVGSVSNEGQAFDGYFFTKENGFVVGRVWDDQGFITQEINWSTHAWLSTFVSAALNAIDFNGEEQGVTVGGTTNTWIFLETVDGGFTWEPAVVNGNGKGFNDVVLVGKTGYAVGYNGQIVKKKVPVSSGVKTEKPVSVRIFPIPAKDDAVAAIYMDNPGTVKIQVVDISGRNVLGETIVDIQPGRHYIPLNLGTIPPGIYICSLDCAGAKATQKFLIQ